MWRGFLGIVMTLAVVTPVWGAEGQDAWVGAGGIVNADSSWSSGTFKTPAVSAAAGIRVSRHVEARVIMDVPHTRTTTTTRLVEQGHQISRQVTARESRSSPGLSLLVAFPYRPAPRWTASFMTGIALLRHRSRSQLVVEDHDSAGLVVGRTLSASGRTFNWSGPTFGSDVAVSLTPQLRLAAEARAIWFPLAENDRASVIFRTGVMLRWMIRGAEKSPATVRKPGSPISDPGLAIQD